MGFYDPCPGDPKLLLVEYTFHGRKYKVENAEHRHTYLLTAHTQKKTSKFS